VEIAESARKHDIPDEDRRHAASLPLRLIHQDADRVLIIGPAFNGQLLEVVVLDPDEDPVAIHADLLSRKFYDLLR
jgi:hypothetical protein